MPAASGGDRFAIVLEFEFLSRIIASMQSMSSCRQGWRSVSRMFEPCHPAKPSDANLPFISLKLLILQILSE
jgi:hypothetical protein